MDGVPASETRIRDVERKWPNAKLPSQSIDSWPSRPARRATSWPTRTDSCDAAGERRALRSLVLSITPHRMQARRPPRAPAAAPLADERRRLERDLHDGVQNDLVALIVKLALAQQDPETPPALVEMLAGLEVRAQAALDSVRNIAHGIYPSLLADFGLAEALRSQAARAAVDVRLMGSAPRGNEAAEEAVYFACSEAIQNAAKHAGRGTQVTLRLHHHQGSLAARHRGRRSRI